MAMANDSEEIKKLLLAAAEAALEALEQALEAEDPAASTQVEWEQEPLPMLRTAIAKAKAAA